MTDSVTVTFRTEQQVDDIHAMCRLLLERGLIEERERIESIKERIEDEDPRR